MGAHTRSPHGARTEPALSALAPISPPPALAPTALTSTAPTHRFGRPLDDRLPLSSTLGTTATPAGIQTASLTPHVPTAAPTVAPADAAAPEDDDGISFYDVLDIINPLHHLPVISSIYRAVSGDEIGPVARIMGGGLFGGVIGAAVSLADVVLQKASGDYLGGHIITALFGGDDAAPADGAPTRLAAGSAPPADATSLANATLAPQASATPPPGRSAIPAISASAFEALTASADASPPAAPPNPRAGLAYTQAAHTPPGHLLDVAL